MPNSGLSLIPGRYGSGFLTSEQAIQDWASKLTRYTAVDAGRQSICMAARREQRKRIKRSITRPSSNALFSNRSSRAAANGPSGRRVGPKTGHERGRAAGPYSSVRDARPDRDNPRINSYRGHGRYPERPRNSPQYAISFTDFLKKYFFHYQ